MSSLLKEVGAIAGLASFLGLALLALLYFAQARDVRRLRDQASFLVEGGANDDGESVAPAERTATAVAAGTKEPEKAAAAAAATAPTEAEAFRRAELARQAAERRQRFEKRRRTPNGGGAGRGRPGWASEPLSLAVIVVGAILLVAGAVFGVTQLTGGSSDSPTAAGGKKSKGPCPPSTTKVAVLNGTATAGLAADSAAPLKQRGYKVGPITNTTTPFDTSVVMFDPTEGSQACAQYIGQIVDIQDSEAMTNEVRTASEGNQVAVVLGDDKTGSSSTSGVSDTTGSGI